MPNSRVYALMVVIVGLALSSAAMLAQSENGCQAGQTPQFLYGFAFLKSQLGEVMGEALECEHYDTEGNAFQRTTTGQASYLKATNTPMFTAGNRHWAWTTRGLEYWVDASPPPPGPAPVAETTAAVTVPLRVMSYNILFGGGATPDWEQVAANQKPFSNPGNRLPEILEVIKAAEPEVVGLQEVAGWDRAPSPVIDQVAAELGMNYFMARSPSGLNVALFTSFEIVEAEDLTEQVGNIGALRATLATSRPNQQLHVFVVHLDPFSPTVREREITTLTRLMAPYHSSPTILMGDMNMSCLKDQDNCPEYQLLSQAGWQLVVREQYLINQIWASPLLSQSVQPIAFPGANFKISDHLPIGGVLQLPQTP